MGYSTDFEGSIEITPPLNQAEVEYLTKFADVRHMARTRGPYFVDGTGYKGQNSDPDVTNPNDPDPSQPGLWCHWVPGDEGACLEWDGSEKTYYHAEWIEYIIDHFLAPGAAAQTSGDPQFEGFTFDHTCNGTVDACGEEPGDLWRIEVVDNKVTVKQGVIRYE